MHGPSNRIMFAIVDLSDGRKEVLTSNTGDRRTHFEWLNNMYIPHSIYKTMNMGEYYTDDNTFYFFNGGVKSQVVEKVSDILFIMNSLIDKFELDGEKPYTVFNGDIEFKINLGRLPK